MNVSPFIRKTDPKALELRVVRGVGNEPRQFTIENAHSGLEDFDREYVSFGGYSGLHDPLLFVAAPDLRRAVLDAAASLVAAISILRRADEQRKEPRLVVASNKMFQQMLKDYEASVQRARDAIAKAEGL